MATQNGVPLLQSQLATRLTAMPPLGEWKDELLLILNAIQMDLQTIFVYVATHQHAALNAVPSTGTQGATTATGAQLLTQTPSPTTAANIPATMYLQP